MADIAPESQTDWYRHWWLKVALICGLAYFAGMAGLLYMFVTLPLEALGR